MGKTILVIGAGAVGSSIGGILANYGKDINVAFVNPWKAHINKINEKGLALTGKLEDFGIGKNGGILSVPKGRIKGYSSVKDLIKDGKFLNPDIILITTRAVDTEAAVKSVKKLVNKKTKVISFQNGLHNMDIIAKEVGPERTIGGVVLSAFGIVGPGVIDLRGHTASFKIGTSVKGLHKECSEIDKCFCDSKLNTDSVPNIEEQIWDKGLVNCVLNPLAALFKIKFKEIGRNPSYDFIGELVGDEALAVAKKRGINLKWKSGADIMDDIKNIHIKAVGEHTGSMLADLGRMVTQPDIYKNTEIESLNGYIVKLAEKYNLNACTNSFITKAIHSLETRARQENIRHWMN